MSFNPLREEKLREAIELSELKFQARVRAEIGQGTCDDFEPLSDEEVWGFNPEQDGFTFMFGRTANAASKSQYLYSNQDDDAKVAMSEGLLDSTGAVFKNQGQGDCFFMSSAQHLVLEVLPLKFF